MENGYKNYRASSIVACLLAETGTIGVMMYFTLSLQLLKPITGKKYTGHNKGIYFAVISAIIAQLIACPDLDLCTLWLWLYIVGLYGSKRINNDMRKVSKLE